MPQSRCNVFFHWPEGKTRFLNKSSLEWVLIPECWVNICVCLCVSVSFVPLQIIMRTLFRLIICTFWYDISFKCWILYNPMVFPPPFFLLLQGSYVCRMIRFLSYWFLYLFISDVLCFVLRCYVRKILGLYHVLMYVRRLHQVLVPRFFCLYRLPRYVDPHVFLVLRSYVCKILGLNHVLMYEMYVVDFYWLRFLCLFRIPTYVELDLFLLVLNSYVRRSNILFQLRIICVVMTIAIFYGVPTYVASYDFFCL